VPFYIPVYSHSQRSPWTIALGLSLYSLFSFKSFQLIPKSQWDQLDGLQTQELKAVFKYYDGQTDDALLTQAVLASAQSMQATVEFSAEVTSIQVEEEKCTITYTQQGQEKIISSKTVINASGPWVSSLLTRVTPILSSQPSVDLVQGTHIVVPNPSQQRQGMYYLEAPQDQRAIFIMPWKDDQLLIGTTENNYHDDPANVKPLACEIEYLLTVYNHHFSDKLTKQDILSSFSGLRVLPKAKSSAFSRPRDTLIISTDTANPRVLSLYGGKLTAYRATAEQVMKQLKKVLPTVKGHQVIETRSIELRK
jgi:glycerol-3-phosphate dehydrogenase